MRALAKWPAVENMNRIERAYSERLWLRLRIGEIRWYEFEPWKLRLAARDFYSPDFVVITADDGIECHEVKATWTKGRHAGRAGFREDAREKIKNAATRFPFLRFVVVRPDPSLSGEWIVEPVAPFVGATVARQLESGATDLPPPRSG